MVFKVKIFTGLLICVSFISFGQTPKSFTHDKTTFLTEMESFLAATHKKNAEKHGNTL